MANTDVMIKSKYHNHFRAVEEPTSDLITEQGAEVTPSELLRRLQAGEPLGGSIYDEYDDNDYEIDPLNSPGVELENYGLIRDVVDSIRDKEAEAEERQRLRNEKEQSSPENVPDEGERSDSKDGS